MQTGHKVIEPQKLTLENILVNGKASSEKILARLVSVNTVSSISSGKSKETVELLKEIGELFSEAGLHSQLFIMDASDDVKKYNQQAGLCVTLGDLKAPGGVMFSGHIDTVDFKKSSWDKKFDPTKLTQEENRLYGRGTVDMKGQVAASIASVIDMAMEGKTPEKPIRIAITSLEEVGCAGSEKLANAIKNYLNVSPELIHVLEPTDIKNDDKLSSSIVVSHRNSLVISIDIKGIPGHSSNPNNGVSAERYGRKVTTFIDDLQEKIINGNDSTKSFNDKNFDPPFPIINIGKAGTGPSSIANGIPGNYSIQLHCRLNPATDEHPEKPEQTRDYIINSINSFLNEIETAMKKEAKDKGLNANSISALSKINYFNQPLKRNGSKDSGNNFKEAYSKALGINIKEINEVSLPATTDAGNFSKVFPEALTLVCARGSMNQGAHGNNEYITTEQLKSTQELVSTVAKQFCFSRNIPNEAASSLGEMIKNSKVEIIQLTRI